MQESQSADAVEITRQQLESRMLKLRDAIEAQITEQHSSLEDVDHLLFNEVADLWKKQRRAKLPRSRSEALKKRGLKQAERLARDERLKQLRTALDAADRVLDLVADPDRTATATPLEWLNVTHDATLAFSYAALPFLIPKFAQQKGTVDGGHQKEVHRHDRHQVVKEMAVRLRQDNPRKCASTESCAKAITADDETGDLSMDVDKRVREVRDALECRECDDPDGYDALRTLWTNLSKGSGSFRRSGIGSGRAGSTKAARDR